MPIAVTAYSGDALENAGRDRHHRHRRHHTRTSRSKIVARHQLDADRLHPRRRPAGSGRRASNRASASTSTTSTSTARRARCSTSTTSSASKCCAGRRARSTAATRSAARSSMSPAACPTSPTLSVRGTLGTYDQADAVATASHPIADMFRVGGSVARLTRDGFGDELHHRRRQLQQGRLGRPRSRSRSASDDSAVLRTQRRLHRGRERPARRPPPDPVACSPARRCSTMCSTPAAALLDPEQKVDSKGVAAHGQIEVADGLTLQVDHRLPQGQEHDADRLRRAPRGRCRRARHLQNKQFSQEFQLAVRTRSAVGRRRCLLSRRRCADTSFDVRLLHHPVARA